MKNKPKLLLQLTDTHLLPKGQLLSGVVNPGEVFKRGVERVESLSVQPNAVVITGDMVEDGSIESYVHLATLLKAFNVPAYLLPGNHDNRRNLLKVFPELKRDEQLRDTEFIQYAVDVEGVRLVALDTLEEGQTHGVLCSRRLQWLQDTLALEPEKPTIIAMHHPPFKTGMAFMDKFPLVQGGKTLEEIIRGQDQVKRIICGHQHRGSIASFAGKIAIVAPSSSHQLEIQFHEDDPFGYTAEHPGVMLHVWPGDNPEQITSHFSCLADEPNPVLR